MKEKTLENIGTLGIALIINSFWIYISVAIMVILIHENLFCNIIHIAHIIKGHEYIILKLNLALLLFSSGIGTSLIGISDK